jgi:hypothetical protein
MELGLFKAEGAVMRARPLLVLFVFCLPLSLTAQTPDRVEIFGGYSHSTYSIFGRYSGPWQRFGYNGFEASVAAKLIPHVAAELDFANGFGNPNGDSSTVRTIMGGPRIFANFGHTEVYGHFLVGELTLHVGGSGSAYAVAAGGGANIWVTRHIGARIIQFDYIHSGFISAAVFGAGAGTGGQNNFRISTGVVFRFGN